MAAHAALYPWILPAAPGCPQPTVDLAINRASAEFCDASRAWEEALDPLTLIAGVDAYEIDLPADAVLVCVRSARLDGHPLRLAQSWAALPDANGQPGLPACAAVRGAELVLAPPPSASGGVLRLIATLRPSFAATSLPEVLVERHALAVAHGAKAFLKEMSGTPWFDPTGYAVARQSFEQAIARARIQQEHGFVGGSLSVTPRPLG